MVETNTAAHRGHLTVGQSSITDLFGPLLLVEADVDREDPEEERVLGGLNVADSEWASISCGAEDDGATSSSSVKYLQVALELFHEQNN